MPRPVNHRKNWVMFLLSWLAITGVVRFYLGSVASQITVQRASRETFVAARSNLIDLINIETGLRGYLIDGTKEYLQPYHEGQGRLTTDAATLRANVQEDAAERGVYRELEQQTRQIMTEFAALIDMTDRDGIEAARKRFRDVPTKPIMDRIRSLIATIAAMENHQLDNGRMRLDRTLTTAITLQDTSLAVTAFFALALMLSLIPTPGDDARP